MVLVDICLFDDSSLLLLANAEESEYAVEASFQAAAQADEDEQDDTSNDTDHNTRDRTTAKTTSSTLALCWDESAILAGRDWRAVWDGRRRRLRDRGENAIDGRRS